MLGKPENPVCPLSYNKPYQKKSMYDTEIVCPFTGYGGETHETLRLLTNFAEDGSTGVLCDVMCYGKRTVCAGTFGMHTSFGNHFTVEVCKFFQKPGVLHHDRTTLSCGLSVLIVGDQAPVGRSEFFLFHGIFV